METVYQHGVGVWVFWWEQADGINLFIEIYGLHYTLIFNPLITIDICRWSASWLAAPAQF
jgi:hypothetical protein